jgi:hypothetical protein
MEDLLRNSWVLDGGSLPPIERCPLKLPLEAVDAAIVEKMEELGFAKSDVSVK